MLFHGLFNSVIPTMEKFFAEVGWEVDDVREMTNTLKSSNLFKRFRDRICARHQWVYCLSTENGKWQCVSNDTSIYALPLPPQGQSDFPFCVFPNLGEIADKCCITFADQNEDTFPMLSCNKQYSPWREDMLQELLHGISKEDIREDQSADYLLRFISDHSCSELPLWEFVKALPLFKGHDVTSNTVRRYSIAELDTLRKGHSLFVSGGNDQFPKRLQAVCKDLKIVIISKKYATEEVMPEPLRGIPTCNQHTCLNTIIHSKSLGPIDDRISLMNDLIQNPVYHNDLHKSAVRYLLHANYSFIHNREDLYILAQDQAGRTWNRLTKTVPL